MRSCHSNIIYILPRRVAAQEDAHADQAFGVLRGADPCRCGVCRRSIPEGPWRPGRRGCDNLPGSRRAWPWHYAGSSFIPPVFKHSLSKGFPTTGRYSISRPYRVRCAVCRGDEGRNKLKSSRCHGRLKRNLLIPRILILDSNVWRGSPSFAAAPLRPLTLPAHSDNALSIISRSLVLRAALKGMGCPVREGASRRNHVSSARRAELGLQPLRDFDFIQRTSVVTPRDSAAARSFLSFVASGKLETVTPVGSRCRTETDPASQRAAEVAECPRLALDGWVGAAVHRRFQARGRAAPRHGPQPYPKHLRLPPAKPRVRPRHRYALPCAEVSRPCLWLRDRENTTSERRKHPVRTRSLASLFHWMSPSPGAGYPAQYL
jgi:hypothetical protein